MPLTTLLSNNEKDISSEYKYNPFNGFWSNDFLYCTPKKTVHSYGTSTLKEGASSFIQQIMKAQHVSI